MFAEIATVGPSTLPLTAGAARSSLTDPVALGLADFLAYWLNASLNPQLAVMTGHTATAVPADDTGVSPAQYYRFGYDPQSFWVRNNIPAIYVWFQNTVPGDYSTLKRRRVATYGFRWIYDEIVAPAGSQHIAGLPAVAVRALERAADVGYHPNYGYGDAEDGTPIGVTLNVQWQFRRLQAGAMAPIPATSSAVGGPGEGGIVRYYPAVDGEIEVIEIVGQQIPRDPEDVLFDVTLELRTNEAGDVTDAVEIMERYLPAPDGSEQP
jgi:hypothetical protein